MSFPTTPTLDSFVRANGSLGANWTSPVAGDSQTLTIISNAAAANSSGAGLACWNTPFAGTIEAYAKMSVLPGTGNYFGVGVLDDKASPNNGYLMEVTQPSSWSLLRLLAGSVSTIASGTQTIAANGYIGCAIKTGSQIFYYSPDGITWTPIITATDSSMTVGSWYACMEIARQNGRINLFGGGSAVTAHTATLAATSTQTAIAGRAPSATRKGTVSQTLTVRRAAAASRVAAQTQAAGLIRGISTARAAVMSQAASAAHTTSRPRSLSAAVSHTTEITRLIAATRTTSVAATGSLIRSTAARLAASQPETATTARAPSRLIAATSSALPVIVKAASRALAALESMAAARRASAARMIAGDATVTASVSTAKSATIETFTAATGETATVRRTTGRMLFVAQGENPTVVRQILAMLLAVEHSTAGKKAALTQSLRSDQTQTASAGRRMTFNLATSLSTVAALVNRAAGLLRRPSVAGSIAVALAGQPGDNPSTAGRLDTTTTGSVQ